MSTLRIYWISVQHQVIFAPKTKARSSTEVKN